MIYLKEIKNYLKNNRKIIKKIIFYKKEENKINQKIKEN